jgi:biotin carboxyl carrier protein
MEEINNIEQDGSSIENWDFINIDGVHYQTTIPKKNQERKPYKAKDPKDIYAFIPGTILKVFVKPKEKVKKGDKLLIFQAMKMSNELLAPVNGVIAEVNIKEGDSVNKSQVLIKIK